MFQSNESKRIYSYLLIFFTVIMFGIAIYLLATQGSSHGVVWGGRYGNKLEGTLNGYGVLSIACGMLLCTFCWLWQNRPKGFSISMGETKNVVISNATTERAKEILSSEYYPTRICMFVTNKTNNHTLQIIRTEMGNFQIYLFNKDKQAFSLIGFHKNTEISLEQVYNITDDFFYSSSLLKNKKYIWKPSSLTFH